MLKNKKVIYLLIPLNLLVWGFFAYRLYTAYTQTDVPENSDAMDIAKTPLQKDTIPYQLRLSYPDPFLKKENATETYAAEPNAQPVLAAKPSALPPQPITPAVANTLPDIKYMGLIRNTASGMAAALVSVNGQSRLVRQNDVVEGISFKLLTRDSLVARLGKDKIVLRK